MKTKQTEQNRESGFALLEYAAGAVVIATVLWLAMSNLGTSISGMMGNVGNWATTQGASVGNDGGSTE